MGLLETALPYDKQPGKPTAIPVNSPKGFYRASFIGMTTPYEVVSEYARDKCRLCKGQGTGYNGQGECRACHGSGRKTEVKTKLQYHLANGQMEVEEVNFKLSPAGTGKEGQVFSPSTLFVRLRELSGLTNAAEEQLDAWYSGLVQPIAIPCQVLISDNKNATYLKITNVILGDGGDDKAPSTQPTGQSNTETRSFQPTAAFFPNGTAAAEPTETRSFQPATMDIKLNNDIMDMAIDGLKLSSEAWNGLLAKHTDGDLVIGKTPQAKATTLLRELQHQKAQRTGQVREEDEIPF